jgi:hypothetical protein
MIIAKDAVYAPTNVPDGYNHGTGGEVMTTKGKLEMEKMVVVEGSYAVAHAVKVCRPNVISAYPITPQTHIVEGLSQFMADGEIKTVSI